jgi:P4 family phage/plasmid primase-like protien
MEMARIFANVYHHDIFSIGGGYGYFYDINVKLWLKQPFTHIYSLISAYFVKLCKDRIQYFTHVEGLDEDTKRRKISFYQTIKNNVCKTTKIKHLATLIGPLLYDTNGEFQKKLNRNSDYELPTKNGTITNLKTLEVRDRKQNDYYTFECPVMLVDKVDEEVIKFFTEIMGSEEKIHHLQKACGLSLTGDMNERIFFNCIGVRNNGKSTLFRLFREILQGFSQPAMADLILANKRGRNQGACTPELMALENARIVYFSETLDGAEFNEEMIKKIIGKDPVPVNPKHANPVTFVPKCKLWICTNKVINQSGDEAFWKKMHYIDFPYSFVDEPSREDEKQINLNMDKILLERLDSVFTWMALGVPNYLEHGLQPTSDMKERLHQYVKDTDPFINFIENKITKKEKTKVLAGKLFGEYKIYCKECYNGKGAELNINDFKKRMLSNGFQQKRTEKGNCWMDIDIIESE